MKKIRIRFKGITAFDTYPMNDQEIEELYEQLHWFLFVQGQKPTITIIETKPKGPTP